MRLDAMRFARSFEFDMKPCMRYDLGRVDDSDTFPILPIMIVKDQRKDWKPTEDKWESLGMKIERLTAWEEG
jgi:hypothetical protein